MSNQRAFRKTAIAGCLSAISISATPVWAQERFPALEEVVVTAQKREQGYTDVPVAVATVGGDAIDTAKLDNFQDLVQLSPSITFAPSQDMRGSGVLIRGLGTTAFQVSVEPTVSTVVDGVVLGRTGSFLSSLTDIERVEVLRGPQGTLFGKNASAGVINVITKAPTDSFESRISTTLTDDGQEKLELMLSGPFSDKVRGRVNLLSNERDGYMKNVVTGEELNGEDTIGVRGKLNIDLSHNTELKLTADYSDMKRNGMVFAVSEAGANDADLENALASFGVTVGPENNEVATSGENASNSEQGGVSAELNADLENFTLTSITAWRYWDLQTRQDIDGLPFEEPINKEFFYFTKNGTGDRAQETDQFSQELRLTSTAWDTVDLTTGLFYWKQELDRYFERQIEVCPPANWDADLPYGAPCPAGGSSRFGSADFWIDTESVAAFGQVDWRFVQDLNLSFGLRYTYDDATFHMDRVTPEPGPALPSSFTGGNSDDGSGVSGKLALQWDVTDEMMTYASYTRGYKAQAFDLIFGVDENRLEPVPKETADAYEVGLKGELFDNRLRLGVAAFHTKFNDFQGQSLDPATLQFSLTSAGTVVTQGLEVDFMARPTPNLLLSGGVALIDGTYDSFTGAGCWQGQTADEGCTDGVQDLTGEQLENAPELKYTLQTRYDIQLDAAFDMYLSANYRWQDEVYSTQDHQPEMIIPSYSILDTTVGFTADDGSWNLALFVKNALDDFYQTRRNQLPFDNNTSVSHGLARDYTRYAGISFTYNWGNY